MLPDYGKKDIHISRAIAKRPVTLARRLTEGKSSEKEKFDAIFAWVASNIRYDFAAYYASGGTGMLRVKQMLKHRVGLCIDYANLMDTLCRLSGITNVSVYGYAKDEIFDVNDSLYLDNHAWNAVRLDGRWYVYDVTWASGRPEYHFTKFSEFIYRMYLRYPPKYKVKKVIVRKLFGTSYCDDPDKLPPPDTILYYKQRFWNKLLIRQLRKFRPKVKRYTTQKLDTAFYLCNPETFAVTHFPDDPTWSLVSGKTVRDFECDSAYYHFHDSLYKYQERYGRPCPGCDAWLGYDALTRHTVMRKESLKFNRRNRFVTMSSEFNIGILKLIESRNFDDSLTKVSLLDTAAAWQERARGSLYQSMLNVEQDYSLQRSKNGHKADLLYNENTAYSAFVMGEKFNIKVQTKSVKDLERKTSMTEKQLIRRLGRVKNLPDKEVPNSKLKTTAFKLLELDQKQRYHDSMVALLDRQIDSLKLLLESRVKILSKGLAVKLLEHDSVFSFFKRSTRLRYYMRDNYKKDVVTVRRQLEHSKAGYMNDLEAMIYGPSADCGGFGELLFTTIGRRNDHEEEAFAIRGELVRRSQIQPSLLGDYKKAMVVRNRADLCWFEKNAPKLDGLFRMFGQFTDRQRDALGLIRLENRVENYRERNINKELGRRKRKYKKIVLYNTKVVNYGLRMVRREKRLFLKKLRDERREAARQSKKKE